MLRHKLQGQKKWGSLFTAGQFINVEGSIPTVNPQAYNLILVRSLWKTQREASRFACGNRVSYVIFDLCLVISVRGVSGTVEFEIKKRCGSRFPEFLVGDNRRSSVLGAD
jgi:hypothetical protein